MTEFNEEYICTVKNKEIIFPDHFYMNNTEIIAVVYSEYKVLLFTKKSLEEYINKIENTIEGTDAHSKHFRRIMFSRAEYAKIINGKINLMHSHENLTDGKMKMSYKSGRLELTRI